jgi:hypothetical protein
MIVQNNSLAFAEDPVKKLNFEKFSNDERTDKRILHVESIKDYSQFQKKEGFKYYLLDLELPNKWINHDTRVQSYANELIYDRIFSICPFTALHRNSFLGRELYVSVFFPFPEEFIPTNFDKKYDLIYCGNSDFEWARKINFMKYNSIKIGNNAINGAKNFLPSYSEKLKLFSFSRIAITWNEYPLCEQAYKNVMTLDNVDNYFKIINKKLTQHKSRIMEAAFTKAIILCKKDEFNIVERIFEENIDFIYFDEQNVNDVIYEVMSNYEKYQRIADNAYEKAKRFYTVSQFYDKFILK